METYSGSEKNGYDLTNHDEHKCNVAGMMAGLRAQTNNQKDFWFAEAGLNNGQLKNVIKLAFSPTGGQRDILYKNSINPIVSFPGLIKTWLGSSIIKTQNVSNCWNNLRVA